MSSQSQLSDLSSQITKAITTITTFLSENNLEEPSLESIGPLTFPKTNDEVEIARSIVREAARKLQILIDGPSEYLQWELSCRFLDLAVLKWINQHNIASHVPLESSISYSDLAKSANVEEEVLKRVVRFGITLGIFIEQSKDKVAHTALSAVFVKYPLLKSWISFCTEESSISAIKLPEALQSNPRRSAFQIAYETEKNHFQWIGDKPEYVKHFAESMEVLGRSAGYSVDHLINGYDWQSLGKAKVIDVRKYNEKVI